MNFKNFVQKAICLIMVLGLILSLAITTSAKKVNNITSPTYSLTSSDGTKITNPHNTGKTTLMIFFTEDCVFSSQLISDLANANWVDPNKLAVIAVGHGLTSQAQLKKYVDTYAKGTKKIKFCYCDDNAFNDFGAAVGVSGQVAVPVIFIIDKNGKIVEYTTGGISSVAIKEILSNYVQGVQLPKKVQVSIKGTYDYQEAFEVLRLINEERKKVGLGTVTMDKRLLADAMKRAEECAVFYEHDRPDGSTFNTVDDSFPDMSENIALGYHDAQDVMIDWMNSPGHRANILDPNVKSVGVGIFYQTEQKAWSQEFSTQSPSVVATPTQNVTKIDTVTFLEDHLKLKLSRSQEFLSIGETDTIHAYINPWEESNQQTLVDNSCLTYKSSNSKVATVSSLGVITPVSVGTTNITVSLNGSNQQAVIPVTVYPEGQSHEANTSTPGYFRPVAGQNSTSSTTTTSKPSNTNTSSQTTVSIESSKPSASSATSSVASKPQSSSSQKVTSSKAPSSAAQSSSAVTSKPSASKPTASSKPSSSVTSGKAPSSGSSASSVVESTMSSETESVVESETSSTEESAVTESETKEDVSEIESAETQLDEGTITTGDIENTEKKPISTNLIIILVVVAVAVIAGGLGIFFVVKKVR